MTSNLTTRWVIVCAVWAAALAFSYWNTNEISVIMMDIEQEEIYRMDDLFWQYNSGKISKILPKMDTMVRPIESLKLGYLVIENNLTDLAQRHHFTDILVEMSPTESVGSGIPIWIYFKGSFTGILPWLKAIEENFPYLPISQVKITTDPINRETRYQIQLILRYRISSEPNQAVRSNPMIDPAATGPATRNSNRMDT
ncbi:MAG: hypothetical protein ABIL58_10060 [Pseudomonadota bacterium]